MEIDKKKNMKDYSEVDRKLAEMFKHLKPGIEVEYVPLKFDFEDTLPEGEREKVSQIIDRVWERSKSM